MRPGSLLPHSIQKIRLAWCWTGGSRPDFVGDKFRPGFGVAGRGVARGVAVPVRCLAIGWPRVSRLRHGYNCRRGGVCICVRVRLGGALRLVRAVLFHLLVHEKHSWPWNGSWCGEGGECRPCSRSTYLARRGTVAVVSSIAIMGRRGALFAQPLAGLRDCAIKPKTGRKS